MSINNAGTLALVVNRNEGTVLGLYGRRQQTYASRKNPTRRFEVRTKSCAFTPDGKSALVTCDGDHRVSILTVDGNKVEDSKAFMVGGIRPYSLEISSKGDVAVFSNQGGGQGDIDVINVIDLKAKPPRVVDTISVARHPKA